MSYDELLDVVDENDNVLYQAVKSEVYKKNLRNRIVSIAVIDPETKNIAVQTRGKNLSWQPGHYCISACGHVGAGEAWDDAAQRELKEEVGVTSALTFINKVAYTDPEGQVFVLGNYLTEYPHAGLQADVNEVDEIFSFTKQEVQDLIAKGDKLHNLLVPVVTSVVEHINNTK